MISAGTGRALVEARLLCDFDECIGIEILSSPRRRSGANFDQPRFRNVLSLSVPSKDVKVYEGSILEDDGSDGDFIFATSTCQPRSYRQHKQMGEKLRPGSIFVTFTKALTSKAFEVLEQVPEDELGAELCTSQETDHDGTPAKDVFAFDKRSRVAKEEKDKAQKKESDALFFLRGRRRFASIGRPLAIFLGCQDACWLHL